MKNQTPKHNIPESKKKKKKFNVDVLKLFFMLLAPKFITS